MYLEDTSSSSRRRILFNHGQWPRRVTAQTWMAVVLQARVEDMKSWRTWNLLSRVTKLPAYGEVKAQWGQPWGMGGSSNKQMVGKAMVLSRKGNSMLTNKTETGRKATRDIKKWELKKAPRMPRRAYPSVTVNGISCHHPPGMIKTYFGLRPQIHLVSIIHF